MSRIWKIVVCDVTQSTLEKCWLYHLEPSCFVHFPIMWILHQSICFSQHALKTAVKYLGVCRCCLFLVLFKFHLRFLHEHKKMRGKTQDCVLCCNIERPQAHGGLFQVLTVIPSVRHGSIFKSVPLKIKFTSTGEAHRGGLRALLAHANPMMICRINGRASSIKGIFRDPLLRPPSNFQGILAAYSI